MEAFKAATQAQPANPHELETVLNDLPRRELVALSKTHGLKASLKRESLVGKLLTTLTTQLWPSAQEAMTDESHVNQPDVKQTSAPTVATSEHTVTTEETTATTSATPMTLVSTKTTTKTAIKVAAVAKKTIVMTTKGARSPGKLKKATPVKPTSMTPRKAMDKIHAKQIAKQPTLQEHEQAKKQRAALLLSGSKLSAVKKTRNNAKEAVTANSTKDECSVTKTLSFGASTPAKKATPMKKTTATPMRGLEVKEGASAKKTKATYKPHTGPLPAYTGDSLFTPKKAEPRPAPMAVAVMKATRLATPNKSKSGQLATKATPVKKASPTKKSPAKKSPSRGKENVNPSVSYSTKAESAKTSLITKKMSVRATVKASATSRVSPESKKEERRAKFAQDSKEKSTATRRHARATKVVNTPAAPAISN